MCFGDWKFRLRGNFKNVRILNHNFKYHKPFKYSYNNIICIMSNIESTMAIQIMHTKQKKMTLKMTIQQYYYSNSINEQKINQLNYNKN